MFTQAVAVNFFGTTTGCAACVCTLPPALQPFLCTTKNAASWLFYAIVLLLLFILSIVLNGSTPNYYFVCMYEVLVYIIYGVYIYTPYHLARSTCCSSCLHSPLTPNNFFGRVVDP